jgi:hypothetical protein
MQPRSASRSPALCREPVGARWPSVWFKPFHRRPSRHRVGGFRSVGRVEENSHQPITSGGVGLFCVHVRQYLHRYVSQPSRQTGTHSRPPWCPQDGQPMEVSRRQNPGRRLGEGSRSRLRSRSIDRSCSRWFSSRLPSPGGSTRASQSVRGDQSDSSVGSAVWWSSIIAALSAATR